MATYEQRQALGDYGEDLAARHLSAAGMVILDRNYRCAQGEIDIVARDGQSVVLCEVKTRRDVSHGTPVEAVTPQKAERLRRLADQWLADHCVNPPSVRIDVISIVVPDRGGPRLERIAGVG